MKKVILFASISALITSCGVFQGGYGSSIQKRKYTSGFYINKKGKFKGSKENELKNDDELAIKKYEEETEEVLAVNESQSTLLTDETVKVEAQSEETVQTAQTEDEVAEQTVTRTEISQKNNAISKNNKQENKDAENKEQTIYQHKVKSLIPENSKKHAPAPASSDAMFILAVIFAILIPPLGVLIYTNIDWVKVLIALLLTILFFLPGMIYALLVVFDVL